MEKETKEWVTALIAGFSKTLNDSTKNFATKDDIKNFATKDDIKNFATKDDIKEIMEMQTEKLIKVLAKYESMTDHHDMVLRKMKNVFDESDF